VLQQRHQIVSTGLLHYPRTAETAAHERNAECVSMADQTAVSLPVNSTEFLADGADFDGSTFPSYRFGRVLPSVVQLGETPRRNATTP
jgi:hypothetical protein